MSAQPQCLVGCSSRAIGRCLIEIRRYVIQLRAVPVSYEQSFPQLDDSQRDVEVVLRARRGAACQGAFEGRAGAHDSAVFESREQEELGRIGVSHGPKATARSILLRAIGAA